MYNFNDKKVLVTGSSRGIGLKLVESFSSSGASVIACSRNYDSLISATKGIVNSYPVVADVTVKDDVVFLQKEVKNILGSLDVLVCNVGLSSSVNPGNESFEEWMKLFSANFFSATNVIESLSSELIKTNGNIVCISSICGVEIIPGAPLTYSVAKAALNSYVKGISFPLGQQGVRINAVAPGNILFDGSVWDKKLKAEESSTKEIIEENVPLARFGDTSDVSDLVQWLASPLAKNVTGSIIRTDGGQSRT
jgi:3-oxoacyl-[acyl-carrier protein] reductase